MPFFLNNQLKNKYVTTVVTGETPADERFQMVEEFKQSDTQQILVATLNSIKEGLNLAEIDTCLVMNLGWSVVDHIQGEDRLHRIGQKNTCNYTYFVIKGGWDERIFNFA